MRLTLAIAWIVLLSAPASDPAPLKVPPLRGTTFAGETVAFPDALKGKRGILILGFSEASRTQVSGWGHRLADDPQRPPDLVFYEMPVLESVPRLLRGWVLRKIRESVSAKGKAHFLPIMDHEQDWKQVAGFDTADAAYLLIVDQDGIVRWRTEQPLTEQAYAEVKRQAALAGSAR